jgi:hypothetical protein
MPEITFLAKNLRASGPLRGNKSGEVTGNAD